MKKTLIIFKSIWTWNSNCDIPFLFHDETSWDAKQLKSYSPGTSNLEAAAKILARETVGGAGRKGGEESCPQKVVAKLAAVYYQLDSAFNLNIIMKGDLKSPRWARGCVTLTGSSPGTPETKWPPSGRRRARVWMRRELDFLLCTTLPRNRAEPFLSITETRKRQKSRTVQISRNLQRWVICYYWIIIYYYWIIKHV